MGWHVGEAGQEESKEEVEEDEVADQHRRHEVRHAAGAGDEHAVPHRF